MISKDEMRIEALKRLKKLKVCEDVINDFKEGHLNYSKDAVAYRFDEKPEWEKMVRDWEKKYDCVAYYVIHENFCFGETLTVFFVSQEKDEEWEADNEDIEGDYVMSYVINLTYPECSECGYVGIKKLNGGIVRTA